ncbi:MAG: UDP-N-acetylmuramoyl-tripeptide--D-alanyl-D-alanine ligase [Elusimicrobia bacterium]|nr:MAG: UDP-N-acetylmuramoyl-tripeptide--D-alanyl-D-alanine ligase [Elusimicrobiota bacterium]
MLTLLSSAGLRMDLNTTWGEAAEATGGILLHGKPDASLRSFSTDSRSIAEGEAFWALTGERFDAHDFLGHAPADAAAGWIVKQGTRLPSKRAPHVLAVKDTTTALGLLARAHRRRFDIPVIGITGSNGKTTVKEMLAAILGQREKVCATVGNYNNEIGLPLTLFSINKSHKAAIVEMGACRKGDIAYLTGIAEPTLGVLTNVGPAHLEFFEDEETVFKTKSELISGLKDGAPVSLFAEDPWLSKLLPELEDRAVTFGWEKGRRVRALKDGLDVDGVHVPFHRPMGSIDCINAAAAAAAAIALGVPTAEIEAGLKVYKSAPLRFARREHDSGALFIVDTYNANPVSMQAGLATFLELHPDGQRIAVLGDMLELGERSLELHSKVLAGLDSTPLTALFLAGKTMVEAAKKIPKGHLPFPVYHALDAAEFAKPLRKLLTPTASVYFKASRLMKLETLAGEL